MYVAFLRSDYYGPFDCLQGLGDFGMGLPCLLPTLLHIPCRLSRVHSGELKRNAVGGVLLMSLPLSVDIHEASLCISSAMTGNPPVCLHFREQRARSLDEPAFPE